jgi:hypothetical protein
MRSFNLGYCQLAGLNFISRMKRLKQNSRTVTRRRRYAASYVNATTFVPVIVPLELPGFPLPFDMQTWRSAVNELRAPPNQVFLPDELEIRRSAVAQLKDAESNKFRIAHRIGYVLSEGIRRKS